MQIGTTTHSAASGAGHAAFEALKFNNGCYAITNALAANTLHERQSAPCESPQLSAEYDAPPSQMHVASNTTKAAAPVRVDPAGPL